MGIFFYHVTDWISVLHSAPPLLGLFLWKGYRSDFHHPAFTSHMQKFYVLVPSRTLRTLTIYHHNFPLSLFSHWEAYRDHSESTEYCTHSHWNLSSLLLLWQVRENIGIINRTKITKALYVYITMATVEHNKVPICVPVCWTVWRECRRILRPLNPIFLNVRFWGCS